MFSLSELSLEDIFLKITLGDNIVVEDGEIRKEETEKIRINLKLDGEAEVEDDNDDDSSAEKAESSKDNSEEKDGGKNYWVQFTDVK